MQEIVVGATVKLAKGFELLGAVDSHHILESLVKHVVNFPVSALVADHLVRVPIP